MLDPFTCKRPLHLIASFIAAESPAAEEDVHTQQCNDLPICYLRQKLLSPANRFYVSYHFGDLKLLFKPVVSKSQQIAMFVFSFKNDDHGPSFRDALET